MPDAGGPDERLRGGVAVITGAGGGLGAGLASVAADRGMRVALADIDESAVRARAGELAERGADVSWHRVDVRSIPEVEAFADDVRTLWGEVTLLVNNAGVELYGNTWELPPEQWRRVVDINLNGVFHGLRAFLPGMIAARIPSYVVTVASIAALRAGPGSSAYSATKHACLALTESVALELADAAPHVGVSAVLPGLVKTRIFASAFTADETGPGATARDKYSRAMDERGMEADEAARVIFDGFLARRLRVYTHPDAARTYIRERAESLATLE